MSKSIYSLFLAIGIVMAGSSLRAAEPANVNQLDAVAKFVEKHLIGKTLEDRLSSRISDGSLETEFVRRTSFQNLVTTKGGLTYDAIVLIKQSLWDLDSAGKRVSDQPRIKDRVLVLRYGVRRSEATGQLIGDAAMMSSSTTSLVTSGQCVRMWIEDGRLHLVSMTPLYADGYAKQDASKPIASENSIEYSVSDGKLRAVTIEKGYDVNPKTLERRQNAHHGRLEAKEIPSLF